MSERTFTRKTLDAGSPDREFCALCDKHIRRHFGIPEIPWSAPFYRCDERTGSPIPEIVGSLSTLAANLATAAALCRAHQLGYYNGWFTSKLKRDAGWKPGCGREQTVGP